MYVNYAYIPDLSKLEQELLKLPFATMDYLAYGQVNSLTNRVHKGYIMHTNEIINGSNYTNKLIFNGTTTIAIFGDGVNPSKTVAKCMEQCGLVKTGVEICIIRHVFNRNVLNHLRHRNPYNWVDAACDILYAVNAIDQKKYNAWIDHVSDIYNLVANYKDIIGEDKKRNIIIKFTPDGKILDYTHRKDIKSYLKCNNLAYI